jgi:hypothetical protein
MDSGRAALLGLTDTIDTDTMQRYYAEILYRGTIERCYREILYRGTMQRYYTIYY